MNQALNSYLYQNFTCDNCQGKFQRETAYSYAPNLDQAEGYYTYCVNCVEKEPNLSKKAKSFDLPPSEATENLPSDKRTLKKTGRIHQFNTSVTKEWLTKLKQVAYEERLNYNQVLERALECYVKQLKRTKK